MKRSSTAIAFRSETDALVLMLRRARRNLFAMHIGRLIDSSTIFVALLLISVVVLLGQSTLYHAAASTHVALLLRKFTDGAFLAAFILDAVLVFVFPRPIIWPEPGDITTLACAPVQAAAITKPLRRRAVLYSLLWRLSGTLLIAFVVSGYMSVTIIGVLLVLVGVVAYTFMRESASWRLFHAGAKRLQGAGALNWNAYLRLGEQRLHRWEMLGIGQIGGVDVQDLQSGGASFLLKRITANREAAKPTTSSSHAAPHRHMRYNTQSPLFSYATLQLGRTGAGFSLFVVVGIGVVVIHNLSLLGTALFAGLGQVWIVTALTGASLREHFSLPWLALFPWPAKRVRAQVFPLALAGALVLPLILLIIPHPGFAYATSRIWISSALIVLGILQAELSSLSALGPQKGKLEWSILLGLLPWLAQLATNQWPQIMSRMLPDQLQTDQGWILSLLISTVILLIRWRQFASFFTRSPV